MPTFRIATWNINSVRLRAPLVIRFLEEYQPDILCLQETKCPPGQFPAAAFKQAGYPHIADNGYTGHHGVAIVSRVAFSRHSVKSFCDQNDGRHVCINPQEHRCLSIACMYRQEGTNLIPSIRSLRTSCNFSMS
jgi:exonuclease III